MISPAEDLQSGTGWAECSPRALSRWPREKPTTYADLQDQLKHHKLIGKKTGFTISQPNRLAYVLQLQAVLSEAHGSAANDLPDGDSGIEGRNVKRKARSEGSGKKKKRRKGTEYMGYCWTAEEEDDFEVEAIVGMLTADGKSSYANQGKAKAGTVLYRIVWKDFPPDMVWYEPAENLGDELLAQYEGQLEAEAQLDAEEAAELAAEEAAEAADMDTE